MDRDADVEAILHHLFDLFDGDGVDLVVDVDALDVLAVALDRVDQVLDIVVSIELDMCIVNFVLLQNTLHHLVINFGQSLI